MIAIVDLVQGVAQANGVDLPAPVAGFQVGVLLAGGDITAHVLGVLVGGDAVGHVVAEGVEVHGAGLQDGGILRLLMDGDVVLGEETLHIIGILTAHMHIGTEPVHDLHLLLVGHHVGGVTGHGIAGDGADHAAHLELGVVVVGILDSPGAGHEHVVQGLEACLLVVWHIGGGTLVSLDGAGVQDAAHGHGAGVDLVEGEPVLDFVLVALEDGFAVVHVEVD